MMFPENQKDPEAAKRARAQIKSATKDKYENFIMDSTPSSSIGLEVEVRININIKISASSS